MLDDVATEAIETNTAIAVSPPAIVAGALCACGSGLAAERCCGLDLRGLKPAEPNPENQERLRALVEARRKADLPAATELSLAILTAQPTLLEALAQLYLIRKGEGVRTAAVALIQRAATLAPTEPRYGLYMVHELIEEKAWGRAEGAARLMVRTRPDSPLAHVGMANIFSQMRRLELAEHHLRRALALGDQRPVDVLTELAHNLQQQGQFDEARRLYEEALAQAPGMGAARLGQIELERTAGAFDRAAERLAEVETWLRPSPTLTLLKARLALDQGEPDAALSLLDAVSPAADTRPTQDWYLRGRALDKLRRYDEAFAAFEKANALH